MAKPKMNYYEETGMQRTQQPVTTGTSVLGIAFDGGVVIAADLLASYGSMARYRGISRVFKVNDKCVIGCGGDYADYQFLLKAIEQKMIDEDNHNDDLILSPNALYSWLTRVQYNRRSKFDPLWCQWVVGGLNGDGLSHTLHNFWIHSYFWKKGKPFLGYVDKIGTAYECPAIATGYGSYIAMPLIRSELDAAEARRGSSQWTTGETTDRKVFDCPLLQRRPISQ